MGRTILFGPAPALAPQFPLHLPPLIPGFSEYHNLITQVFRWRREQDLFQLFRDNNIPAQYLYGLG